MNHDANPSDIVDFTLLLERLDGDVYLMRELAALYILEYPRQLQSLIDAVSSGDLQRVQHAAHTIKGTARSFAAMPLEQAASALEDAKELGDGIAIWQMTERLSHELRRLEHALEKMLVEGSKD
jgi:HPt (histidine-containing phosphotransfer) domain-containing protein